MARPKKYHIILTEEERARLKKVGEIFRKQETDSQAHQHFVGFGRVTRQVFDLCAMCQEQCHQYDECLQSNCSVCQGWHRQRSHHQA